MIVHDRVPSPLLSWIELHPTLQRIRIFKDAGLNSKADYYSTRGSPSSVKLTIDGFGAVARISQNYRWKTAAQNFAIQ